MTGLVILLGGPALLATLLVAWDLLSRRQVRLERLRTEAEQPKTIR